MATCVKCLEEGRSVLATHGDMCYSCYAYSQGCILGIQRPDVSEYELNLKAGGYREDSINFKNGFRDSITQVKKETNMFNITAEECSKISNSMAKKIEIHPDLIKAIEERIKIARQGGEKKALLNSLSDNGHGVRGIDFYLSEPVYQIIKKELEKNGFKVFNEIITNTKFRQVLVTWK